MSRSSTIPHATRGDLGITITGVFATGDSRMVLIDGESVEIGRKHKHVRPFKVSPDMIEMEVDDAGRTVTVFVRY